MFQDPSGKRWDSAYFRAKFLIPILDLCRLKGEPILTPYDDPLVTRWRPSFTPWDDIDVAAGPQSHTNARLHFTLLP